MAQKQLDTLVEDIYSSLSNLSNNEPLDIDDASIDQVGEAIKKVIKEWARPAERNKKFSLRMSNIGKPARQLWFENKYEQEDRPIAPHTFIKFLYGHLLEEIVLMLVRLAEHNVTDEQKEVEVSGVRGHIDCKIDNEVVDIKTASGFSFIKFKNETLREDDPFGYIAQLAGYENAEGTKHGGLLVLNKESGELTLYRPEELDKPVTRMMIEGLQRELKLDTPPPLCYDPVPDGSKGNMRLARNCVYCPFKFKCFEDLRVFKYAKGPQYLTKVVSTPRVEEITSEF
mgnify:FL=1